MIPNTARTTLISGFPGNLSHDGPTRARPGILDSTDETANVFGRAFTFKDTTAETMQAGGAGVFAGILINPKNYAIDEDYARNGAVVEFLQMGQVYVRLETDGNIGDLVYFDPDDGSLSVAAPSAEAPDGLTLILGAVVSRHEPSAETPRLAVITLNGPVGGSPAEPVAP